MSSALVERLTSQIGLGTVRLSQDRGGSVCGQRQAVGLGAAQGTEALTCCAPLQEAWLLVLTQAFLCDLGHVTEFFWAVLSWG